MSAHNEYDYSELEHWSYEYEAYLQSGFTSQEEKPMSWEEFKECKMLAKEHYNDCSDDLPF